MGSSMAVTFNYSPHAAQIEIHKARGKRFRTVCTGRRFGKTLCLAAELLDRGGCEMGGDYGWIAPTYNVAERGIEAFRTIADGFIQVCGRAPTRVEFTGSAGKVRVWFLSADNPDNIRGFGFQGVVIDEAAAIPADVWHYVLRPTIAQTLGWAVFVSTPKGHNWFFDLFTRGMEPGEADYASFTFPSKASPYFPVKEWEEARRTLPEDVFRQEYMAEFLEDSAGVFRNVEGCLLKDEGRGMKDEYIRNVVIGCDVAKHTDWTVLIAMDAETGRCFAMERFNQLDWPIQKERILGFARRYGGRIILDATGIGDPIYDDLKRVWPDIEGFKLTSGSKTALIQRLIVAVEQRKVSWPAGSEGVKKMQAAFREETDTVISPHLLCSRDSRGYVSSGSRDASHLGQADGAVSSARGSGQQNAAYGLPHPALRDGSASDARETQHEPIRDAVSPGEGSRRIWSDKQQWEVLTNEMKRFEYEILPSGTISYNAPAGYHDDCVMALALANHRRWETESVGSMLPVGGGWSGRERTQRRGRERVLVG